MVAITYSEKELFNLLSQIPDPEIPVINIQELGVLRSVKTENGKVTVEMTPTYSGCPALDAIEHEIISQLHEHGIENVEVKKVLSHEIKRKGNFCIIIATIRWILKYLNK